VGAHFLIAKRRRVAHDRKEAAGYSTLTANSTPLSLFARQFLALCLRKLAQLFFAHRSHHLSRGAFERGLRSLSAFGGERGASGHLLFL
jgi:hypothetical protein